MLAWRLIVSWEFFVCHPERPTCHPERSEGSRYLLVNDLLTPI